MQRLPLVNVGSRARSIGLVTDRSYGESTLPRYCTGCTPIATRGGPAENANMDIG